MDLLHATHLLDVSTLLIARLENLRRRGQQWTPAESHGRGGGDVKSKLDSAGGCCYSDCLQDGVFVANLLHLLRRLQHLLFQTVVHRALRQLEEIAAHLHEGLLRELGRGRLYKEWPAGYRPLNTTWPWDIRPCLLVLWGVCWMFYASSRTDAGYVGVNIPSQSRRQPRSSSHFLQGTSRSGSPFPLGSQVPCDGGCFSHLNCHHSSMTQASLAMPVCWVAD